uniref:Paxillin n=1 Tax=Petromyzon marinus TaxID=7757 RepID=S4R8B0_PETMA
ADALLADLESTTSHLSKRPAFLQEDPYTVPTAYPGDAGAPHAAFGNSHAQRARPGDDVPPPIPPPPSLQALNGGDSDDFHPRPPPPPAYVPSYNNQTHKGQARPGVPGAPRVVAASGDHEHIYSLPNKPKSAEPSPSYSSSFGLGSNLSELDRILQELNCDQYSLPGNGKPPPMPRSVTGKYGGPGGVPLAGGAAGDKGFGPVGAAGGRGVQPQARPSVDNLLSELKGSVPPADAARYGDADFTTPLVLAISRFLYVGGALGVLDEMHAFTGDLCLSIPGQAGGVIQNKGGAQTGDQLDSMLGSLQSDLNRQGVATLAKGQCAACLKPIAGQVVTAMGRTWHPEHFVCTECQEEIGARNFFERDGLPYCEKDYHFLFSPRCAYCSGPILDKVVTALDKTWHPEHFFCVQCGHFFGDEGFHEKDGKPYCRQDYFEMFAPKCGGCSRAIVENYISALSALWHPECFVCRECFTPFINGSFFEHEGQPYCEVHYHERRGSLCSGCQKPITGRCITAMAKKFHPEHFVCAFCLKQLNKGTFKEQNDKPYCHPCFIKLFG